MESNGAARRCSICRSDIEQTILTTPNARYRLHGETEFGYYTCSPECAQTAALRDELIELRRTITQTADYIAQSLFAVKR